VKVVFFLHVGIKEFFHKGNIRGMGANNGYPKMYNYIKIIKNMNAYLEFEINLEFI
jgi:hypothetical protein